MTSDTFQEFGNVDVVKEQLMMSVNGTMITGRQSLITYMLPLLGPGDLLEGIDDTIHLIHETQNKTTQMRPNQSRTISIYLTTPTATWLFAGYPYTTGTQKAVKISTKNKFFNWVHSRHQELMNASHSTNLFTNSCDQIFTNGKAPLHSHINHNNPQFLYSLWRRANARNISFLNLSRW